MAYYSIYYKHDKVMETLADNKPILSNRRALLSLIASLLNNKCEKLIFCILFMCIIKYFLL